MKFDAKMKGGLAWAGLVLILAVPSADILMGGDGNRAQTLTSDMNQVKPVPAAPAADPIETASVAGGDPVDAYLEAGKELPSYISDGNTAVLKPPAAVAPVRPALTLPAEPQQQVAALPAEDEKVAPIPLPRDMRPTAPTPAQVASLPAAEEAPLIIDETELAQREAALGTLPPSGPVPPAAIGGTVITGDELQEWDSGSLADYLERKGLLSEASAEPQAADGTYDPDGFYLDEGPNRTRRGRPAGDWGFFLF